MTKAKWMGLAERAEKATGPDREIDFAIGFATGWRRDMHDSNDMIIDWEGNMFPDHYGSLLPSVTESLDAITTAIERELPRQAFYVGKDTEGVFYCSFFMLKMTEGSTLALALCAAFCRAMAERAEE